MRVLNLLRNLLSALVLLPLLWSACWAQNAGRAALDDTVPGKAFTYLRLVEQVIPNLVPTGSGDYRSDTFTGVDAIGGEGSGGEPPESTSLSSVSTLDVRSAGRNRLLLLIDLGSSSDSAEGYAVLALYDLVGEPRLLDATNVALDRSTWFREPARLAVSADDDVVMTSSTHFNSSQGYSITLMITVRDDQIQLIDTIYTFDENLRDYKRSQNLAFQAIPEAEPYAAIRATVTETTEPAEEPCGDAPVPAPSTREIAVTYRWDQAAGRFVADSDAFEKLSAENEERF